jgi:predicted ATPase with chaperone activity
MTQTPTSPFAPDSADAPETGLLDESAGPGPGGHTRPVFLPPVPTTVAATGINQLLIEDLMLKNLLGSGLKSGRDLAADLKLPFPCIKDILNELKTQMLIAQKSAIGIGDFVYQLSDRGRERALAARAISGYAEAAPVRFEDYLESVKAQSIRLEKPDRESLAAAFDDLIVNPALFDVIGPALSSGRGLFLYGAPGNGKTALAERMCKAFGDTIYLPRTLFVEGELIQLFDPEYHVEVPPAQTSLTPIHDQRWVRIKRPLVVVGGELTLDQLEIRVNEAVRVCEAPLQLKANCGIFLIDDFGRQRVHHDALLNRWIVPLERQIDYLSLPNGKRVRTPFDELIVFSTNLEPSDLVDDAFLRRIPYKIHVKDPTESEFETIMRFMAPRYGIEFDDGVFRYLVERHYKGKRPFRTCQARDILEQIVNSCSYRRSEPRMTEGLVDDACRNYFSAMGTEADTGD